MPITPWLPSEEMEAELLAPVLEAEEAGLAEIEPALEESWESGFGRTTAMAAAVAAILTAYRIRRAWELAMRKSSERAQAHWEREAKRAGILDRLNNPDLPERDRERWRRENEARYILLRDRVRRLTEQDMRRARDLGTRSTTYAKELRALGLPTHHGRMRGRGVVIAGDQLWSLAGIIARHQQLDAGIDVFRWRTMRDSRVRSEHRELQGKVFPWSRPPSVGIPGEPINCRCFAEAVLDDER